MKIEQYVCDVCGKTRGEGNHWVKAVWNQQYNGLEFVSWSTFTESNNNVRHICSDSCATRALGSWLDELRRTASK